jgi:peptidoglycan hydrolase-like amidase
LIWVKDPGSIDKEKLGHGVGVPWSGVRYFVNKGWIYPMILKYFLKGVEIQKL